MVEASKRLFFGFSVEEPWPSTYPKGRILEEDSRHLTVAFLGNRSFEPIERALSRFPLPPFIVGPVGFADRLLFLPQFKPRVVAQHIEWLGPLNEAEHYHDVIRSWIDGLGFAIDKHDFLPHVTLARTPFDEKEWESAFEPLPMVTTGFHLYESVGNLKYVSIWHIPLLRAFEEFEHTADIAFYIRAHSYQQLYFNAAVALSFTYPPIIQYVQQVTLTNLDGVVKALNQLISQCDLEIGCPFKAISYHGKLEETQYLQWEMIVDV